MATVLVTGANRGLGLEFVRQCAERGDEIIAACRHPEEADDLHELVDRWAGNISPIAMDVSDEESVKSALAHVAEHTDRIDILINNAGVYPQPERQSLTDLTTAPLSKSFAVNVGGPMLVTRYAYELLGDGSKVINMSSGYGSIENARAGWPIYYCATKAALNMFSKIAAAELRSRGVIVISMNPGWVKTDMGGPNATLNPEESISGMLRVIAGLSLDDSGTFRSYDGSGLPW